MVQHCTSGAAWRHKEKKPSLVDPRGMSLLHFLFSLANRGQAGSDWETRPVKLVFSMGSAGLGPRRLGMIITSAAILTYRTASAA